MAIWGEKNCLEVGNSKRGIAKPVHHMLAREPKLLQDVHHLNIKLAFWDYDTVEEKNIFRQNFCEAEVGLNKAETLARRFGLA